MSAMKPISAAVQSAVSDLSAELHAAGGCEKVGLTHDTFAAILSEVAAKYLSSSASSAEARTFLQTLRVEELALARACAQGHNHAWEVFLTRYREKLYQAALRIAREDSAARDLADTLYAELYGTSTRHGERVSKLASFTGRGSLEGWLRTVLAQEFVNRYRRTKRLVSLDEESRRTASQFAAPPTRSRTALRRTRAWNRRPRFALGRAFQRRPHGARIAYYLDGRTLAEVAGMLGVHESTISRKVDKLAKFLRKEDSGNGHDPAGDRTAVEAEEALEVDVRDLRVDIRRSSGARIAAGGVLREAGCFAFSAKD
jgi:RNA polymerase sigma-70 factor (ECF subfamily)